MHRGIKIGGRVWNRRYDETGTLVSIGRVMLIVIDDEGHRRRWDPAFTYPSPVRHLNVACYEEE